MEPTNQPSQSSTFIMDCEDWWLHVRLSWLGGRALPVQARDVLDFTPGDCQPFHFPLFSPHNI